MGSRYRAGNLHGRLRRVHHRGIACGPWRGGKDWARVRTGGPVAAVGLFGDVVTTALATTVIVDKYHDFMDDETSTKVMWGETALALGLAGGLYMGAKLFSRATARHAEAARIDAEVSTLKDLRSQIHLAIKDLEIAGDGIERTLGAATKRFAAKFGLSTTKSQLVVPGSVFDAKGYGHLIPHVDRAGTAYTNAASHVSNAIPSLTAARTTIDQAIATMLEPGPAISYAEKLAARSPHIRDHLTTALTHIDAASKEMFSAFTAVKAIKNTMNAYKIGPENARKVLIASVGTSTEHASDAIMNSRAATYNALQIVNGY